jgi:hypothetical protein
LLSWDGRSTSAPNHWLRGVSQTFCLC